jgi:uncharacterized membrane protein
MRRHAIRGLSELGAGGKVMTNYHVVAGVGDFTALPVVRKIGFKDIEEALAKGLADFWAMPSHAVFLSILYPIVGLVLVVMTSGENLLPLLYPLLSGFALVGPFAALGLYEVSRRRELGLETTWLHAYDVLRSPSVPAIAVLGVILTMLFVLWVATAEGLYSVLFHPKGPQAYVDFLREVFTTPHGWTLLVVGNILGLVYTIAVFSMSVVSFPLLLDRDVGAAIAIKTSFRAVIANPGPMALWGIIVAVLLALGMLALIVGLAVVIPVLGHATWHLYRRVVEPARGTGIRAR